MLPPWRRTERRDAQSLAGTLRRRGVRRIAWFHCEHFAPWRVEPERDSLSVAREDAAGVDRFAAAIATIPQMMRATLFYQPHLVHALAKSGRELSRAATGDAIGFLPPNPAAAAARAKAIGALGAAGYDIQVRLDHRRYIWTPLLADDLLSERLARPEVRAYDGQRFELALRLSLGAIRRETGRSLSSWLFAHADHALAGSDVNRCTLPAELPTLARHGCVGDFSLPGVANGSTSTFGEPFLIRPIEGQRPWELQEAAPERAWSNGWSAAEKLLVWTSPTRPVDLGSIQKVDADSCAADLIERGTIRGETLWLRTEAVTAIPSARGWSPAHDRPAARRLIELVRESARRADVEIADVTATEAYRAFVADRPGIAEDTELRVPRIVSERRRAGSLKERNRINLLAIDEVFASVAALGLKESGATEFYQGRAEKGQVLASYETLICEVLLDRRPGLSHVYEAGCGAGVFTLLMAANGLPATGIDRHAHRVALAERVRERVVTASGPLAAPCEFRRGRLPQVLKRIDGRNAALVFTNVIGALTEKEEDQLIRLAARFRATIVDLARFFRRREGAEQQALLDKLAAAGFPPPLRLAGFPSFRVYLRDGEDW